jgi:hypothetical protein
MNGIADLQRSRALAPPKFPNTINAAMFLPRLATAGPSRRIIAPASVHTRVQCARLAIAPTLRSLSSIARPSFSRPAVTRLGIAPGLRSYATPRRRSMKNQLTGQQWPWHVVENPPAGMEEIERVIFARANKTLGKTFWAMSIVFTFGIINWMLLPTPNQAIEKGIKPEEDR